MRNLIVMLSLLVFGASAFAAGFEVTYPGGDPRGWIAVSMKSSSVVRQVYELQDDGTTYSMTKESAIGGGSAWIWFGVVPIYRRVPETETRGRAIGYIQIEGPSKISIYEGTGLRHRHPAMIRRNAAGDIVELRVRDRDYARQSELSMKQGDVGGVLSQFGDIGLLTRVRIDAGDLVCRGSKSGKKRILDCRVSLGMEGAGRTSIAKIAEFGGRGEAPPK